MSLLFSFSLGSSSMRRPWWGALVFALAVTFQVLAPATAGLARGNAAGVCVRLETSLSGERAPFGHEDSHKASCLFCQVWCSGGAPVPAKSVADLAPAHAGFTTLAYGLSNALALGKRDTRANRARGPPAFALS